MNELWFPYRRERPRATMRLFCFPHGGGAASAYRAWHDALPEWIEVVAMQPPGRESRFGEPFATDLVALAKAMASAMTPLFDRPFALFGHSMGSLVAYEVTRALEEMGARLPSLLCVSGTGPPSVDRRPLLPDDDNLSLIRHLKKLGGTPDEILNNADIMGLALPPLRADYRLIRNYPPKEPGAVSVPLLVIGGTNDDRLTLEVLEQWKAFAKATLGVHQFPGGHFYLNAERAAVLKLLVSHLKPGPSPAE